MAEENWLIRALLKNTRQFPNLDRLQLKCYFCFGDFSGAFDENGLSTKFEEFGPLVNSHVDSILHKLQFKFAKFARNSARAKVSKNALVFFKPSKTQNAIAGVIYFARQNDQPILKIKMYKQKLNKMVSFSNEEDSDAFYQILFSVKSVN